MRELFKCNKCEYYTYNKKSYANHMRGSGYRSHKFVKNKLCLLCNNILNKNSRPTAQGKFCNNVCYSMWRHIYNVGELAPNFKDGKCNFRLLLRASLTYRRWRTKIFIRDKFTCQKCNRKSTGNIEAHHIIPFSSICHKYKINSIKSARKCKQLWNLENGITLCKTCHKKTKNYGYNKYTKKT